MALTIKGIARLNAPGRYGDGGGLYLQIGPTGGKAWLFRYVLRERERWMGLGPCADFTLDEARERARKARQQLRDGIDPIEARKAARATHALEDARTITFKDATDAYFNQHSKKWSSAKHHRQFLSAMRMYADPVIGRLPVASIDTGLVLKCVEPIWQTKTQTASRLRGWIENVLDWSAVRGYRAGENPARWQGHLGEVLPAKKQITKIVHHKALPYAQVPAFIAQLAKHQGTGPLALTFIIMCAARTGEALGARWPEIDFEKKVWTIPASRMKGRREHRVPLTSQMLKLLKSL